MLIVVVLVIITLLALLGASFSFRMNADLASVNALREVQQARLAAESGIARAILLLRENRNHMDEWYDNWEVFHRNLVWAPGEEGGSDSISDKEEVEGRSAWRFSIVSYEVQPGAAQDVKIRYGLTDEAGKIDINQASRLQLLKFFRQFEFDQDDNVTPQGLADALIDWRDKDNKKTSENSAESSYYFTLDPPYRAKNKPFETVEELLMVKGYDGQLLYGEDFNRNGYLDPDEDNGREGCFPPDDGNGTLERGFLPYLTVYSWDWNSANDNKRRIDINAFKFSALLGDVDETVPGFPEYLLDELRPDVIQFIADAQERGYKFRSIGELLELEVFEDGSSNYDKSWKEFEKKNKAEEGLKVEEEKQEEEEVEEEEESEDQEPDGEDESDQEDEDEDGDDQEEDADDRPDEEEELDKEDESAGEDRLSGGGRRSLRDRREERRRERDAPKEEEEEEDRPRRRGLGGKYGGGSKSIIEDSASGANSGKLESRMRRMRTTRRTMRDSSRRRGTSDKKDDKDDKDGKDTKKDKGTPIISTITVDDMEVLMDRLTVDSNPTLKGLINVNTAHRKVLMSIPGLSEQQVDAIIARRQSGDGEDKLTPAWLVADGVLDAETFALVSNMLTTRSLQFTIDAIGFADHVGTLHRIRAVVEMRGHLSQIKYYCDITSLGIGYPVRDNEMDDRRQGFDVSDR
jgi:type II secretory pathway component PulK